MKILFKAFACLFILCLAGPAFAGTIKEYAADMVDVAAGKTVGKYYVAENKMRMDSFEKNKNENIISIIRLDQQKMYALQPSEKTYLEIPMKGNKMPDFSDIGGVMMGDAAPKVKKEKVGSETVSGYQTDKYKVVTTMNMFGKTHTSTSYVWLAKEFDIPVRTQQDDDISEMRNIKTGAQAASLFEIPSGYTKTQGLDELMNMGKHSDEVEKSKSKAADAGKAVNDAGKEVKDSAKNAAMDATKQNVNDAVKDGVGKAFKSFF